MHVEGIHPAAYRLLGRLMLTAGTILAGTAQAGSFELGNGIQGTYKIVGNYSVGVRTGAVEDKLINGPVDPFVAGAGPSCQFDQAGQTACFSHSGLPVSINFDDANRNFKQWSLINNRVSVFGELALSSESYGIVISGNGFYDRVYHESNDNTSPRFDQVGATVNKYGTPNEFTDGSSRYDGYRFRLLDAYAYGEFPISDEMSLNLRFGKQVIAYGESLFLSGISSTMGPFDATKAFVAGAEIKDIILPETRIGAQLAITSELTLLAEYQLDYSPTEIFSVGSYFSPADLVGPGARFAYGSENPAVHPCPGLANLDPVCQLNTDLGIAALLLEPGAPSTINVVRGPDIMPNKYGHYSVGLKYQITPTLNLGYFHTRYADHNPSVVLNPGFAYIGTVSACNNLLNNVFIGLGLGNQCAFAPGVDLDTNLNGVLRQYVPVSYQIAYADNLMLDGITFSTVLGPFNVAGEFNYRRNIPIGVKAIRSGVLSPENSRGDLSQILISALYTNNPRFIADEITFVGEMGAIYVNNVERAPSTPGTFTLGNGDELFYDRLAYGFQTLTFATVRNIIDGWDLQTPLSFGMLFNNPSMAGAFGPLYGDGDTRLSFGAKMQYLQNLEFAINYNMFFGDVDKKIGDSTLHANPYVGRDYATFNVKYSL